MTLAYGGNDWLLVLGALTLPWGGAINTFPWWRYAPGLMKRRT